MDDLNLAQARELLRSIPDGCVFFSGHAQLRLKERGLSRIQALRVLRGGSIQEGPAFDASYDSWIVEVEGFSAGDWLRVSAGIGQDKDGPFVTVKTVFAK